MSQDIMKDFIESEIIQYGIKHNLVSLDSKNIENIKYITYHNVSNTNIKHSIINPEERVQAKTYLELIRTYEYPQSKINMFVKVTMGSSNKEADIVIYKDDEHNQPYIIVECKREEVSEQEFQQASSQAFAYAHALAGTIKYVWVTSGIKDEYFVVDKDSQVKEIVATIPKYGTDKVPTYKYAKGGQDKLGNKLLDLEIVKESELTRRFQQAHQALWGGGELNPSQAFDELDKLIFCKIWDERNCPENEPYDFQIRSANIDKNDSDATKRKKEQEAIEELSNKIKKLYEIGKKHDPEVFKDDIRLNARRIHTVVGYLQDVNLSDTDFDSKGKAFETFMGSFFRGDFGQFFTPRPIVDFIVNSLPIDKSSYVLDTSCGSGGFLLHALDKVRKIEAQNNNPNDPKRYPLYYKNWHDFASKNLYGIEINEQIARTAKMNMILHDDGHTNVISSDGLIDISDIQKINPEFKEGKFDFIITNPPFGSLVKQAEKAYLRNYDLGQKETDWLDIRQSTKSTIRNNQKTEILFIEQCHRFLTDGGFLAIVLPDGILTNSSMQYVRDNIEEKYRIVAVISLPQTAFTNTGAGVKSSILFLRKYSKKKTESIIKLKENLREEIKIQDTYEDTYRQLKAEQRNAINNLIGLEYDVNLNMSKIKKSAEYKEWKNQINNEYNEKINNLKEELNYKLQDVNIETIIQKDMDYDIFIFEAFDIGYDATGNETSNNELLAIQDDLAKFINQIIKVEEI